MSYRYLSVLFLGFLIACGDGEPPSPVVSVTSTGGTIFIGDSVQFQASVMDSNGTRDVTNEATWGSDAPSVATVSPTGLVTAVAAGEATIYADVNPRGMLKIRVFPSFRGMWSGNDVVAGCEETGFFEGFCDDPQFRPGQVFSHRSSFTQNEASVDATIVTGPGTSAMSTGTITVGGLLELPSAPSQPADPVVNVLIQNWRSRADTPGRMTGSYEGFFTAPGVNGTVTLRLRLENVVRGGGATVTGLPSPAFQHAMRRFSRRVETLR